MSINSVSNFTFYHRRAEMSVERTVTRQQDGSFTADIEMSGGKGNEKTSSDIQISGDGDGFRQRTAEHETANGATILTESTVAVDRENRTIHREGTFTLENSQGSFTKDILKTETGYTKDAVYTMGDKTMSRSITFEKTDDGMSRQVSITLPDGRTVTRTRTDIIA